MRARVLVVWVVLLQSLSAFGTEPRDEVLCAAMKLAESPNYNWTTAIEGALSDGASEGKTERNGPSWLTISFHEEPYQIVILKDKAAAKGKGGWASLAELVSDADDEGPTLGPERFMVSTIQNFKTPAALAESLCRRIEHMRKHDESYSGALDRETVETMVGLLRRRFSVKSAAPIAGKPVAGTVEFRLKDAALSRIAIRIRGTVFLSGNERDIDRTTIISIKDIGSTKLTIPQEARAKL